MYKRPLIARAAILSTLIYIASQVALGVFLLWSNAVYSAYYADQTSDAAVADAIWMDEISVFSGAAFVVCLALTLIVNARWIYTAARDANRANPGDDRISAGWAVGWYLVPIMNWFKPYQAMEQIWTGTVHRPTPGWFGLWWGSWVALSIADNVISRVAENSLNNPDAFLRWNMASAVTCFLWVVPAVLFLRIIREVSAAAPKQAEIFA